MTEPTPWSDAAWAKADHIYRAILRLPFVRQLADGSLPRPVFDRYIGQDSLYLATYCRVLSHIASRLSDISMTGTFLRFAAEGVAVEQALHSSFITAKPGRMSPACLMYTSLLSAQSQAPVEVEAAAVLPCFWVYQRVGQHIAASGTSDNPYAPWIATYSDPAFDHSTAQAIEICDRLAAGTSASVRAMMTDIFVQATRMEWLFWHGAYTDLRWPEAII